MKIKITPTFEDPGDEAAFDDLLHRIMLHGWTQLLLYYDDGSVLLKKMDAEKLAMLEEIRKRRQK